MTEYETLYRAVVADPCADDPRLKLAGWLYANGDPDWAKFIRLQCYLNGPFPGHCRQDHASVWCEKCSWADAADRLPKLLRDEWPGTKMTNEAAWSSSLLLTVRRVAGSLENFRVEFDRGFPSRISCPLGMWLGDGRHRGIAGPVCSAFPITAVCAFDRHATEASDGNGNRVWEWNFPHDWLEHALPSSRVRYTWSCLPTELIPYVDKTHPTSVRAYGQLGQACLEIGRLRALGIGQTPTATQEMLDVQPALGPVSCYQPPPRRPV